MAKYTPRRAAQPERKPLFPSLFSKDAADAAQMDDDFSETMILPAAAEAQAPQAAEEVPQTEELPAAEEAVEAEAAAVVADALSEEVPQSVEAAEAEPIPEAAEAAEPEPEAEPVPEEDEGAAIAAAAAAAAAIAAAADMEPEMPEPAEMPEPEMSDPIPPESNPPAPQKRSSKAPLIAAILAAVLAAAYMGACAWVDPTAALPKTSVNGSDVSGMNASSISKVVADDFKKNYAEKALTVTVDGEDYTVPMGDSLALNADAVAKDVLAPSSGSFFSRGWYLLRNVVTGSKVTAVPSITNQEALSEAIQGSGLNDINTTTQTTYELTEDALVFTMGKVGHSVDTKALNEALTAAVAADDYATALECPLVDGTVEPVDVKELHKKYFAKMANATLDPKNDYAIVPSVEGVDFDQEAVAKALSEAAEGADVSVPVKRTKPVVTTQQLKDGLFRDVLGTYTTHVKGTSNRLKNVQQAAANINGTILLPGDVFSYNGTVGERTAENGFYTAGAYLNGQTVQEYGGGVCQVSSTEYIAVVRANLEIVERHNHTYVSTYVPLGMDATVSWGGPDFQFRNNRDYPVKVTTYYNPYSQNLAVSIVGTNVDGSSADLVGEQLSWTDYAVIYKDDPTMYEGQTRKEVDGEPAAKAQTYRVVYNSDGKEISRTQESYSSYTRRDEIVYRGTKKKPVKKPAKTPAKTDDTTTAADPNAAKPDATKPSTTKPNANKPSTNNAN